MTIQKIKRCGAIKRLLHIAATVLAGWLALSGLHAHAQETQAPQDFESLTIKLNELAEQNGHVGYAVALIEPGSEPRYIYWGQADREQDIAAGPDTLWRIGSTSKMFVGLATLQLVEDGVLSLDDKLSDWLPELVHRNRWKDSHPIRLVHLLEHTTGWDDMHIREYAHQQADPIALDEALTLFPDSRESRWPPGSRQAYCNTGPAVMARVIEKATGQDFESYVADNLFQPLNMRSATYFQPENYQQQAAKAYMMNRLQEYWHLVYRPSGSINATAEDMSNLLQALIDRGQFNNRQIVSAPSVIRMETPHSTPGYRAGIRSGYALTNMITGHGGYHTAFYGHDGAVLGAMSMFQYSPELEAGFILLSTGNGGMMHPASEAIKGYLLRNKAIPAAETVKLDDQYRQLEGLYRNISPRTERMNVVMDALSLLTVWQENNELKTHGFLQPWETGYIQLNEGPLVNPWHGLPELAVVQDPLVGEAVQVGGGTYVSVSPVAAYSRLALLFGTLGATSLLILSSFVWAPLNLAKKTFTEARIRLRYGPTAAAYALFVLLLTLNLSGMNLQAWGSVGIISLLLWLLSVVYAVCALWAVISTVTRFKSHKRYITYWVFALASALHGAFAVYLASYGMIGITTWTL